MSDKSVHKLLDKLTLESIALMEQHIQSKLLLEQAMSDGEIHLAKSRYIMGQNTVSQLQLPNEDSEDITARFKVTKENSTLQDAFTVQQQDPKANLKWFGVLVPQSLQTAQKSFRGALNLSVYALNVQEKLQFVLSSINHLKKSL